MNKLKWIKKQLKINKKWKQYKSKYKHKQMKFIFSKIALIYNSQIDVKLLVKLEEIYLKADLKNGEATFAKTILKLTEIIKIKADWKSFGKYIFYVYQTATFYHDNKHSLTNVFSKENYINKNNIKRSYFNFWLESLDHYHHQFNTNVIKVLKVVT